MNRETRLAIMDYTSIVISLVAIAFTVLTLTSCAQSKSITFDVWYEQVINEPYDPLNGSKF